VDGNKKGTKRDEQGEGTSSLKKIKIKDEGQPKPNQGYGY
jgi:hypothetical protein